MKRVGVLLAAGLGTRLRPLTDKTPKPLVKVAGMEPLFFLLHRFYAGGLRRVVVNAHHLPEQIQSAVQKWLPHFPGLELRVSVELPEILGGGGALVKIAREQRDWLPAGTSLLVHNADSLFGLPMRDFFAATNENIFAVSTLPAHLKQYGPLWLGKGDVYAAVGKDNKSAATRATHFIGLQHFNAATVALLSELPARPLKLFEEIYEPFMKKGQKFRGVELMHTGDEGFWFDIGTPQDLQQASDALQGQWAQQADWAAAWALRQQVKA